MVNMRAFNDFEERNLKFLVNHNVKFTQVEVTPTGLKKSILDATAPMRTYFIEQNYHDYQQQIQGPQNKVVKDAVILTESSCYKTHASFYRPLTKKGDPRMWIYNLGAFTTGNDIYVLFILNDILYTINITRIDIEKAYNSVLSNPIKEILGDIYRASTCISEELLPLIPQLFQ